MIFDVPFFQHCFVRETKSKNVEKKAVRRVCTEGVGGLAEAAGKVRKGKPSGPGQHTHWSRTTPAPLRGTANLVIVLVLALVQLPKCTVLLKYSAIGQLLPVREGLLRPLASRDLSLNF